MSKKVLVVYYSQTGQLKEIVNSFTGALIKDDHVSVTYEELKPDPPFPFPWTSDQFFQTMPESVKGIPCKLKPLSITGDENFDLVVVAWQPWFLSPSIPTQAFFQHPVAKKLLNNKPVITIIGSRNMWVMAQDVVKQYIHEAGGRLVGNIMLQDKASNLLSVISVIRWMFKGKKDRYGIIPPAGISQGDIAGSAKYGELILPALLQEDFTDLQNKLVGASAVDVKTKLVMIEKRGIIFFRIWAGFILKKGGYRDPARVTRVRMFKYYLLTVLYLVSPFASLLYFIIKPFRKQAIKKQTALYQSTQ